LHLIRSLPSCAFFHCSQGIFLGWHYGLIYASCVYDFFLYTVPLFSVALSDGRQEMWVTAEEYFSLTQGNFSLQCSYT
jgi:hypothetical protein